MKLREYFNEDGIWYRQAEEPMPLEESSLARIWKKVEDENISFGVVSAFKKSDSQEQKEIERNKKENLDRHGQLRSAIRAMDYGYIELKGGYKYEGEREYTLERSFLIPNITKEQVLNLGRKFGQETVIFKDANDFGLLKMNGETDMSFMKKGGKSNLQLGLEAVKEYFSSLVKGGHAGRKFAFKLMEHEKIQNHIHAMALDKRSQKGTTALRWWKIYED